MSDRAGASAERVISFGPFRLLPKQRLLLEGGRALRLGSRALDILIALVERPGELLAKDELVARVWPNTVVEESNLKVHIAALRRAIGDGSGGNRYLITVPGRGYSFVTPVTLESVGEPHRQVSSTKHSHNLPTLPIRLIGRSDVVSNLVQQLPQQRLLTIVGPGGIGKTSVALAVAEDLIANYINGVWLVDVAPIGDAGLVPSALAAVLDLEIHSDNPLPGLVNALRDQQMLVVLDNCEHVLDGAARLAAGVLRGTRAVDILATSREPLRVQGERVHPLGPLVSPPPSARPNAEEARTFSAIQLFVERATASTDEFKLDDADLPIIADICQKLDGIPLAIEFAAARVSALGVRGLAARIEDRLRLLTHGPRAVLARHQTMRATLDWSYDLLREIEQRILQRLSIFAGGFTLQAACMVAGSPDGIEGEITDQVLELVTKSLICADVRGDEPRYRLLETTRAYALEKLRDSSEFETVTSRHAEYYRDLMETASAARGEVAADSWHATYSPEIDNVRAALAWALAPRGNAVTAVALAAASAPLWLEMSLLSECCRWMEAALAVLDEAAARATPQEMVLQTEFGLSLMFTRGKSRIAYAALTRASELAENLEDSDYQLRALAGLITFCHRAEEFRDALALARRSVSIVKGPADPVASSVAESALCTSLLFVGEYNEALICAQRAYRRTVPVARRADILRSGVDHSLQAHGVVAQVFWLQGLPDQAAQTARVVLADAQADCSAFSLCRTLAWCGCTIYLRLGDLEAAEQSTSLLKDRAEKHGLKSYYFSALGFEGHLSAKRGDIAAGQRLLRAALDGLREAQYELLYTPFLSTLAEVLAIAGHFDDGLAAADEALHRTERNHGFWWMPEALRIKGEVLLLSEGVDSIAAEDHFCRATDLAHRQGALSWELRAATSLARLRQARDHRREARELLASVYGRFSEGFDTADLKAARRIVDEPI
jgi:predicted ATPase/DNA-binding winged helix-turn-helix (wHTH) protein